MMKNYTKFFPALALNLLKGFFERSRTSFDRLRTSAIFTSLLLTFTTSHHLHANDSYRNCIILLNSDDTESVGSSKWFLMGRLQSAIAEKTTPLLVSASLW